MKDDPIPTRAEMRKYLWDSQSDAAKAYIGGLRKEAETAMATWGQAFKDGKKVRAILNADYILSGDARALRRLLDNNAAKQRSASHRVKASELRGVTCNDETIERAIVKLTELDADERKLANQKGWSSSTGPGGHWCFAMLTIDRALALKEARRLIALGGHQDQLKRLGIDVGAAA